MFKKFSVTLESVEFFVIYFSVIYIFWTVFNSKLGTEIFATCTFLIDLLSDINNTLYFNY